MSAAKNTFARASSGYDTAHEEQLLAAITTAIAEASKLDDTNAIVIRTGEIASALLTALASILAMSPAAARSPTAVRRTIDEPGRRLRFRVAQAEGDPTLQEFLRAVFHGNDVGGNA